VDFSKIIYQLPRRMKSKKTDTFEVKGDELLKRIKELVKEGNVRRISIIGKDGVTLLEFPLTIGVVGAVLLPVFTAVGAIAALVTECTIKVDRRS